MGNFSRLGGSSDVGFNSLKNGFGVVTVMNVKVYAYDNANFTDTSGKAISATAALAKLTTPKFTLDTLKISNLSVEASTKSITGGQTASTLLKVGSTKTARLEMQDALGHTDAIDALCGGVYETTGTTAAAASAFALHVGTQFNDPVTIVGDTYFIDKATGKHIPVNIIIYNFYPDDNLTLTMDAEGDAAVFDMNGDLTVQKVLIGTDGTASHDIEADEFFSIVAKASN